MRVAAFLVYLFYLLLGGYNYVGATPCHIHSSAQHNKTPKQLKFTFRSHSSIRDAATGNPHTDETYLLDERVEDEDTNNLLSSKLLICYSFALSYLVFLGYHYRRSKIYPHTYAYPPAPLYITQRVLRI